MYILAKITRRVSVCFYFGQNVQIPISFLSDRYFCQEIHCKNLGSNNRLKKLLVGRNTDNNTLLATSFLNTNTLPAYIQMSMHAHMVTSLNKVNHVFVLFVFLIGFDMMSLSD